MSRKKANNANGSLDLLLDTMCNAFGGIVLIAILVAMLIKKPGSDGGKPGGRDEENIKETESLLLQWSEIEPAVVEAEEDGEKLGDLVDLIVERDRLEGLLLEKQTGGTMSLLQLLAQLEKLVEEKAAAAEIAAATEKEVASLEEKLEELKRQLKELEDQEKAMIAANKQELRPPKLEATPGQQLNFLVRYGEVFPTQILTIDAAGNLEDIQNNTESLLWEGNTPKPVPGKGLKIGRDDDKIKAIIEGVKRYNSRNSDESLHAYAISIVYGDSFDTINDFRRMIQQAGGIRDGWEPAEDSFSPSFGAGGATLGTQ